MMMKSGINEQTRSLSTAAGESDRVFGGHLRVLATPLIWLMRLMFLLFYRFIRLVKMVGVVCTTIPIRPSSIIVLIWTWLSSLLSHTRRLRLTSATEMAGGNNDHSEQSAKLILLNTSPLSTSFVHCFAVINSSPALLDEEIMSEYGEVNQRLKEHHHRAFQLVSRALKLDETSIGNWFNFILLSFFPPANVLSAVGMARTVVRILIGCIEPCKLHQRFHRTLRFQIWVLNVRFKLGKIVLELLTPAEPRRLTHRTQVKNHRSRSTVVGSTVNFAIYLSCFELSNRQRFAGSITLRSWQLEYRGSTVLLHWQLAWWIKLRLKQNRSAVCITKAFPSCLSIRIRMKSE